MESLNLDSYFEGIDNQYYDSKYIITILENILGNKFDDIRNAVNGAQIVATKEQIVEFLEKKFEEENPETKIRIELYEVEKSEEIARRKYEIEVFGYYIEKANIHKPSLESIDQAVASRYHFEPYTLEYFKKYSNIVRNKALLLLNIIEKIGNRDSISIQDLIAELDIKLDKNGNISKEDIIRLITPTIYNIDELNEIITKANDLLTYLTFKMSLHYLNLNNLIEEEIYPSSALQIKVLNHDYSKGYIPLSNKQKKELKKEETTSFKKIHKMLINLS